MTFEGIERGRIALLVPGACANLKATIGWEDLLRSVPHIKFGNKTKAHRYLDHSG